MSKSDLKTRKSPFGQFPLSRRTVASRTCYPSIVYFHYNRQNFGLPSNLREDIDVDPFTKLSIANGASRVDSSTSVTRGLLEEEIKSVRISKSLMQMSSSLEINLHPSQNWKQLIAPGDWMLVYMHDQMHGRGKYAESISDTKNMLMLANVDRVARSLERQGEGNDKAMLKYTVSARGFGKVFEDTDIWYDPYATQEQLTDSALLTAGLQFSGSPDQMIYQLLDVFLGKGANLDTGLTHDIKNWRIPQELMKAFDAKTKDKSSVPKFDDILNRQIPVELDAKGNPVSNGAAQLPGFKAHDLITLNSNGSLANMLTRNSNSLVNELFLEDVRGDDGSVRPTIVLRPRPLQTPFFDDLFGKPPAKEEPAEKITYKVVKGDNLTKIAKRNNTTIKELLRLNPQIKNPDLIYPGQVFTVKEKAPKAGKPADAALKDVLMGAYKTLQQLAKESFIEVSQAEIKYENLGKDDHSRMNLFWLTTTQNKESAFSHMSNQDRKGGIANPTLIRESIQRHGLKKMEQNLDFCYPVAPDKKTYLPAAGPEVTLYRAFMAQLYDMHFANHLYDAGTISCTGVLEAEIGKALIVKADPAQAGAKDKVYYIEGYEHEWTFPSTWMTTFTLSHGQFKTDDRLIFIDNELFDSGQMDIVLDAAYLAKTFTGKP
jgi:LysM repeat protein